MITSELFGTAPCGTPVHRYTLDGPEICVRIMDYGATVLGIDVPDIPGNVRDVVLGFDKLEDYFDNPACFGATIGPVANRTAGATIAIDGTDWHMPANEGANNLHSDLEHGLHKRVWDVELDEVHNAVRMTTSLKDGELGLPGNRTFTAVFTVMRTGVFRIDYGCESDRATYVSMTNHTYFNLAGHNAGMDCEHFFVANAAHYLPINEQNIPTGEIAPVEGTPFDFRELRPVAPGMEADDPQIKQARGYDHCLCIDGYQYGRNLRRAMHVEEMWTGREMDYFEVNSALLSRGRVVELEHLKDEDIATLIERALEAPQGLGGKFSADEDTVKTICTLAAGDARSALTTLELASEIAVTRPDTEGTPAPAAGERYPITVDDVKIANPRRGFTYDKNGDMHYDIISAFIKSMRGSDPDATIYWLARMIDAGEDPKFIARRIMIHASEDVGNADPQALLIAHAAFKSAEVIGYPECRINLAQAALYVCLAPKSNACEASIDAALADIHSSGLREVPSYLRDRHRPGSDEYGVYKYPHDYPEGWVDQRYLPEGLERGAFWQPAGRGWEEWRVEQSERDRSGNAPK